MKRTGGQDSDSRHGGRKPGGNGEVLTLLFCFLAVPAHAQSDCAADGYVVNAITGGPVPRAHLAVMPSQTVAATDNEGRFSLKNLPCGRLQITATRPGYLVGGAGTPRAGATFTPWILTSGVPAHDIKIRLMPQSVVMGKVVDDAGDPVPNAQINAWSSQVVEGRRLFQMGQMVQSNDLGEFRMANLPAGRFIFCARNQTIEGIESESCYPGPVDGGLTSAIELFPGRETRVDFHLSPASAVHVRGTILGMPKNQGAAVTLQPRGPNRSSGRVRPASITPDGRFDVRGVTPGSYVLGTDYWEGGSRLTARVPVEVGSSDVEGIVVQLEPGIAIEGTVRAESSTAIPDQPWSLSLQGVDPPAGVGQLKWTKDRTGFVLADMSPGSYRLGPGGPPAPFYVKSALLGGRDLAREDVPILQSGRLEIVLADDSGSIEGTTEDGDGRASGAWIMVVRDGKSPRIQMSGPDGHFRVTSLAPGDYRVYAWDDVSQVEYADAEWMRRHGSGVQPVAVQAGQTASVKLALQSAGR